MIKDHVIVNERINAIDYLQNTKTFLSEAELNPLKWKWVCIALFHALYGFSVCTLKFTTHRDVKDEDEKKEKPHLISFDEAIKRCQKQEFINKNILSKPLILRNNQRNSLNFLHKVVRNQFIYFYPKTWFLDLNDLSKICWDVTSIIEFLVFESGSNFSISLEKKEKKELEFLCKQIKVKCVAITSKHSEKYYFET